MCATARETMLIAVLMQLITLGCVSAYFLPPDALLPDFHVAQDPVCRHHGAAFRRALESFSLWAVQMFDSSAKYPTGLLVGNGYELGAFDECLSVRADLGEAGEVRGQYCLVDVYFHPNVTLAPHFSLDYHPRASAWSKLRNTGDPSQVRRDVVHWALCVPASCSPQDTQDALQEVLARLSPKFNLRVDVLPEMCQTQASIERRKQFTTADFIIWYLGMSLVLFVVISSFYDKLYHNKKKNSDYSKSVSLPGRLLLCFSAPRNFTNLVEYNIANTGVDCIHGVRLFLATFVIFGHRKVLTFSKAIADVTVVEQSYRQWQNMYFLCCMVVIDNFFFISGFLNAYHLLQDLDKKHVSPFLVWVLRFVRRVLRLTPLYLAVLLFRATLLGKLGSGPLWPTTLGLEHQRCAQNWWLNLLYLNNYIKSDQMCMFQSWYLSVDTHLFMVAVVVVYCMWRWPLIGTLLLVLFGFLSISIPFLLIICNKEDPFMLLYPHVLKDLVSNQYFRESYVISHTRAGPYVIGVAVGYLLHKIKDSQFTISKVWICLGYIWIILVSLSVMYGGFTFYEPGAPYRVMASAVYGALHRIVWAICASLILFLLVRGRIDWLHKTLTWSPLVSISRLTYCTYLVHTLPHLYEVSIMQTPYSLSGYTTMWMLCGDIVFTFLLSLFLYLLVEAPFRGIEKIILGGSKSPQSEKEKKKN